MEDRTNRLGPAVTLIVVGCLAYQAFLITLPNPLGIGISGLLTAAAGAAAAYGSVRQCRRARGRARVAWAALTVAALLWTGANACYGYDGLLGDVTRFPRPGHVLSLLAEAVLPLALLAGPAAPATIVVRMRIWLDAALIAASLFFLFRATAELTAVGDQGDGRALGLFLPLTAVVALSVVVVLVTQSSRAMVTGIRLMAYAFGLFAGFSLVMVIANSMGWSWRSTGVGGSNLAATLLLVLAARYPLPAASLPQPGPLAAWRLAVPYVPAALALAGAGTLQARTGMLSSVLLWTLLAITASVCVRQFLALHTNKRLLDAVAAQQRQLAHQATHDPLTGLGNRILLAERLAAALARPAPVAVLIVDLDGFKGVNDRLGHGAGDELLKRVAEQLRTCVGRQDVVVRLGGDEFVIVLPESWDPGRAGRVAERIVAAVAQPVALAAGPAVVGASVGVAVRGDATGTGADDLLRAADSALYRAKESGKGRVCHAHVTAAAMR